MMVTLNSTNLFLITIHRGQYHLNFHWIFHCQVVYKIICFNRLKWYFRLIFSLGPWCWCSASGLETCCLLAQGQRMMSKSQYLTAWLLSLFPIPHGMVLTDTLFFQWINVQWLMVSMVIYRNLTPTQAFDFLNVYLCYYYTEITTYYNYTEKYSYQCAIYI